MFEMDITECGAQVLNDTKFYTRQATITLLNIFLCAVVSGFSCKVDRSLEAGENKRRKMETCEFRTKLK